MFLRGPFAMLIPALTMDAVLLRSQLVLIMLLHGPLAMLIPGLTMDTVLLRSQLALDMLLRGPLVMLIPAMLFVKTAMLFVKFAAVQPVTATDLGVYCVLGSSSLLGIGYHRSRPAAVAWHAGVGAAGRWSR